MNGYDQATPVSYVEALSSLSSARDAPDVRRTTSRGRTAVAAILCALITVATATGTRAGTFTAFGPESFTRETSTPVTVTRNFTVLNPHTSYALKVTFPKGSAANISVNGVLIFSASEDFRKPAVIERPVNLLPSNQLSIRVEGKPGTTITVEVRGTDTDLPTIRGMSAPSPNGNGWNRTDVTVTFVCDDATSGIASCSAPSSVSAEGGSIPVTGTAVDRAGNSATATVLVNIDKTPPTFSNLEPAPCPATVNDLRPVVVGCYADALSGIRSESVSLVVDGVDRTSETSSANGCIGWTPRVDLAFGEHSAEIRASDNATNPGTQTWCFSVGDHAAPLAVIIDSPHGEPLTSARYIDVSGQVEPQGSPIQQVLVNRVPAALSGNTFTASGIPLAEGFNPITATAQDAAGRVGTATENVIRDTAPARVVITVPRDGGVVVKPALSGMVNASKVDPLVAAGQRATTSLRRHKAVLPADPAPDWPRVLVAGEVNDTVVGTVNARDVTITVNGIPAMVMNRGFRALDVPVDPATGDVIAVAIDAAGNRSTATIRLRVLNPGTKQIVDISGNNQTGMAGAPLAQPFIIELRDENDQPVPNVGVIFRVSRGDGTFSGGERSLSINTGPDGRASASFRLGVRFGCANNRVEASSVGYAGRVFFTADATPRQPDKIHIVMGQSQLGVVGKRLPDPFTVMLFDDHDNGIEGVPITFRITEGGGHFDNDGDTQVVETDSNGWGSAHVVLGPIEGNENNVVEASFEGMTKLAARFSASARAIGRPEDTRVVGLVFDNTDAPIPGATVSIVGTDLTTVTDAQGRFAIPGAPIGSVHVMVDGSTTTRDGSWPSLVFMLVTVAGRDNDIGRPMYLPLLNESGASVSETRGGIATVPTIPGFKLEIAPGSARFVDGTKTGVVSVTQVHPDKVPMPPPMGMAPPIVVAIMPHDVQFDPPAKITLPNFEGLSAGETTELFSFDHDLEMFISIGTGTVTEDGASIVSDPGQGIIKGGWHCGGPAGSSSSNVEDCPPILCQIPVSCDPATGNCSYTYDDAIIGGFPCDREFRGCKVCSRGQCIDSSSYSNGCSAPLLGDNPAGGTYTVFGNGQTGACDIHDRCYARCGNDKHACDREFCDNLTATCLNAALHGDPAAPQCYIWSVDYCAVVDSPASLPNYNAAQSTACMCQQPQGGANPALGFSGAPNDK